jgi:GT2 family glycosyltransferase
MLEGYPGLQLIVNSQNLGFAVAINQGIKASNTPYIGALNDDAFPEPEWLEALVSVMEGDSQIGSCASLMVFAHKPGIVQSAGIAIDRAAIAWDRLRGKPVAEAQEFSEVFGASAGAALYRRAMLEEIGLFDERFFAYLEDVDLAWRAQIAGWRCQYVPTAVVRHLTSASFGEDSPLKKQLKARNKVWMVVKNAPITDLPLIFLYDWMAVFYTLLVERDPHPLLGRLKGLRRIYPFLKDRHPGRPRILEPLAPPWQVPKRWQTG